MRAWKGNDSVAGQRGGTAARWRRAAVAAAALAVPLAGAGIAAAPASAAGSSTAAASAATFYKGEVLISEFRLSGPRGAHDEYAELYNTGAPVSLAGFKLTASPGAHRARRSRDCAAAGVTRCPSPSRQRPRCCPRTAPT